MGRNIFSFFKSSLLLFSFTLQSLAFSAEIDSFTNRNPDLQDSTVEVNAMANRFLSNGAKWANFKKGPAGKCLHFPLYEGVYRQIKGLMYSKVETLLENNPKVEKIHTSIKNSIYRRVRLRHGFAMILAGLGSVLRVGDHYVGTDKFGHFFDTGYDYYHQAFRLGKGEPAALRFGERTEWGIYGYKTTGVYSYGDLVANYQGFQFWKHLTDRYGGKPDQVFFQCEDGNWKQVRTFDIRDFIDAGWDEGINCSKFKSKGLGRSLNCPLQKEKCGEIVLKYGERLPGLVSPACRPMPSETL